VRIFNDNYAAKFEAVTKKKRYSVRIDFEDDNSDPVWLLSHADSAYPPGAVVLPSTFKDASTIKQRMKTISSIGGVTVEAVDTGAQVTEKFREKYGQGKGLSTKRVRVYDGFHGQSFDDYEIQSTNTIGTLSFKLGLYKLFAEDVQRLANDAEIFIPVETRLSRTLSETETGRVYVFETGIELNPHGASYSDAPNKDVLYVWVEKECVRCTGWGVDGTYGPYYTIDTNGRGALGTVAVEHSVDSGGGELKQIKVIERFYIEMPTVKFIYAILQRALNGQSGKSLPLNYCADIDAEFVANDDFINNPAILDIYDPSDDTLGNVCYFGDIKKTNAKKFIEQKLLPLIGCFMPVYPNGEWGLNQRPPIKKDATPVAVLDESNIVSFGELKYDYPACRNRFIVDWHFSALFKKTIRSNEFIFPASILRNKKRPVKTIVLEGLHGSRHSLSAITEIVQRHVDRTVEPPLLLDLDVLPKMSNIENGDVVLVRTDKIRDYTGATNSIDRSFEVVGGETNLVSGKTSFECEGSSGGVNVADLVQQTTNVLPDSYFIGPANREINATNFPGAYTNTGGVGHITADITLTGGATFDAGEWWHDGDLTIDFGATVFLTGNARIFCTGHRTTNGNIDGVGGGPAGGTGYSGQYGNEPVVTGGVGSSRGGSGGQSAFNAEDFNPVKVAGALHVGTYRDGLPRFALEYDGATLKGLPSSLTGVGGRAGNPVTYIDTSSVGVGGDGGSGGAALQEICRGASFGASAKINLSGGDGSAGSMYYEYRAGPGAPGHNGAYHLVIDGNGAIPDLSDVLVLETGDQDTSDTVNNYFYRKDKDLTNIDRSQSFSLLQFVPGDEPAEDEQNELNPTPVTGLTLSSNYTKTNKDGSVQAQVFAQWTPSTDPNVDKYEIQIKLSSDLSSLYRSLGPMPSRTDNNLLFAVEFIEGQQVDVRMRSINKWGEPGQWHYSTSNPHTIVGKNANPNAPSGLVATPVEGGVKLSWINASDADLRDVRFYQSATNSRPASPAFSVGVSNIGGEQEWVVSFQPGTTQYFWIDHFDTTFHASTATNPSSATGGVSGTAGKYKYSGGTEIDSLKPAVIGATKNNIYAQASAPTSGMVESDVWFDTDDGNKLYRYESGAWVMRRDADINQALVDAAAAQATADGAIQSYYQATAPSGATEGDIWFDTDDGNRIYIRESGAWVNRQDSDIVTAISNASTAQATADGKVTTFFATSTPTAEGVGDLWYNSSDKLMKRWTGAAWSTVSNAYTEGDLNAINLINGPAAAGAEVNAPSITININKMRYTGTLTLNTGEAFINGFRSDGVPDIFKEGEIVFNGARITLPWVNASGFYYSVLTSQAGSGYIVFDTQKRTGGSNPFTVAGTTSYNIVFAKKEAGQWYYDSNTAWVSFTPDSSMTIIGTMVCDSPENIYAAEVWQSGVSLDVAAEASADQTQTAIEGGIDAATVPVSIKGIDAISNKSLNFRHYFDNTNRLTGSYIPSFFAGSLKFDTLSLAASAGKYTDMVNHRKYNQNTFAKDIVWKFYFEAIGATYSTDCDTYIGLNRYSSQAFGLKITGNAINVFSKGTSTKATSTGLSIPTSGGQVYEVEIRLIHSPSLKIEFYIDGVLKYTETNATYIPGSDNVDYLFSTFFINNNVSASRSPLDYHADELAVWFSD